MDWLNEPKKTRGEGLVCFDTHSLRYRWFRHQPGQPHSLSDDLVKDIIQYPKGVIWVATAAGVDRFEPSTGQFSQLSRPTTAPDAFRDGQLMTLFNGPMAQLLIGTLNGLTVVNAPRSEIR